MTHATNTTPGTEQVVHRIEVLRHIVLNDHSETRNVDGTGSQILSDNDVKSTFGEVREGLDKDVCIVLRSNGTSTESSRAKTMRNQTTFIILVYVNDGLGNRTAITKGFVLQMSNQAIELVIGSLK